MGLFKLYVHISYIVAVSLVELSRLPAAHLTSQLQNHYSCSLLMRNRYPEYLWVILQSFLFLERFLMTRSHHLAINMTLMPSPLFQRHLLHCESSLEVKFCPLLKKSHLFPYTTACLDQLFGFSPGTVFMPKLEKRC